MSTDKVAASAPRDQLVIQAKQPGKDEVVTLKLNELKLFSNGVYSNVYTGTIKEDGKDRTVAVKKCWGTEENPKEIRILSRLNRNKAKNVATLLYVFSKSYGDKICYSLVMEFVPTSLAAHIRAKKPVPLDLLETKLFTWQMFRGVQWLHANGIVHRDLKPQNILVNPETCLLQVADFGSSLMHGEYDSMSSYHVTRYYRPPELLLGSHKYGAGIDIWSAGCVFGEMLRGRTLLPGNTTDNQLERILECFGPPTPAQLQAMHARRPKLLEKPDMVRAIETYNERGRNSLPALMPLAPPQAIKLMEKIMRYAPRERLCGPKLLGHSFFDEIFDPNTLKDGKPLKLLTKEDLASAVAGDVGPGMHSIESHTGGSGEQPPSASK